MADPMTWMVILSAIGTALSVVGIIVSARSQEEAGQVQQQGYEANAEVIEADATVVESEAAYSESQHREKVRRLLATQRSLYAKSGVDLSSGSPLVVLGQTAAEGEEESLQIRRTGQIDALRLRNQAKIQKYYGGTTASAASTTSKATLLTGLGGAALNFGMASKGMWKTTAPAATTTSTSASGRPY